MASNLYLVLRNTGWPVNFQRFEFHDVIELSDDDARDGVESGYLVPEDAPKDHPIALTEEQRALFDDYRDRVAKVAEIAAAKAAEEQRLITDAAATHTPVLPLDSATATHHDFEDE